MGSFFTNLVWERQSRSSFRFLPKLRKPSYIFWGDFIKNFFIFFILKIMWNILSWIELVFFSMLRILCGRILHLGLSVGTAVSLKFDSFFIPTRVLEKIISQLFRIFFRLFFRILQILKIIWVEVFYEFSVGAAISLNFDWFSILTKVSETVLQVFRGFH